jgi:two-component system, response regulator PdtaR
VPSTRRAVVLVVEDEWLVRDFLVSHLQDAGWRVLEAESAEQAIAMLKAGEQIDIVITDIQLKGVPTGWDVADAFRAAQPTMPVIYASGNAPDPSRRVPESLFFRKPYDPDAILRSCRGFT